MSFHEEEASCACGMGGAGCLAYLCRDLRRGSVLALRSERFCLPDRRVTFGKPPSYRKLLSVLDASDAGYRETGADRAAEVSVSGSSCDHCQRYQEGVACGMKDERCSVMSKSRGEWLQRTNKTSWADNGDGARLLFEKTGQRGNFSWRSTCHRQHSKLCTQHDARDCPQEPLMLLATHCRLRNALQGDGGRGSAPVTDISSSGTASRRLAPPHH